MSYIEIIYIKVKNKNNYNNLKKVKEKVDIIF